jgi:hypothetical protein
MSAVLVIDAHPNPGSLCTALAGATPNRRARPAPM